MLSRTYMSLSILSVSATGFSAVSAAISDRRFFTVAGLLVFFFAIVRFASIGSQRSSADDPRYSGLGQV